MWLDQTNGLITKKNSVFREPVSTSADSLDPRHVFLVDGGLNIFVWYGRKCKNLLKSKARLMSEKINKIERKDKVKKCICGDKVNKFISNAHRGSELQKTVGAHIWILHGRWRHSDCVKDHSKSELFKMVVSLHWLISKCYSTVTCKVFI